MFHLQNQIILISLLCIFSNLVSAINRKEPTNSNPDEDTKKDIDSLNDLYGQTLDDSSSDQFFSNVAMIKKSLNDENSNDEQLNSLININWEPVDWPLQIDTSISEDSDSDINKKASKKSLNYVNKQPKRTIYRPIRAQRCLKRGSLCDPGSNPLINCCSHSVCRCNFFNDQCRCDRMNLLQRWGR